MMTIQEGICDVGVRSDIDNGKQCSMTLIEGVGEKESQQQTKEGVIWLIGRITWKHVKGRSRANLRT